MASVDLSKEIGDDFFEKRAGDILTSIRSEFQDDLKTYR